MYVKNVLKPGHYVEVLPEGIPIVLQYNSSGHLEMAYYGFSGKTRVPSDVLTTLKQHESIPSIVPIKNGTTWVKGVLYTGRTLKQSIVFDENCYSQMIEDFINNPTSYNFFAALADSTALTLSNATAIRQWISISKFHCVPGFLINSAMTKELYYNMLKSIWTFKFPMVMAYVIFDGSNKPDIIYTGLGQIVVEDIQYDVDENGFISVLINSNSIPIHLTVSSALSSGLAQNDIICLDNSGDILHVSKTDASKPSLPSLYCCPVCGKKTQFTTQSSIFRCSNTTCPTTLYTKVSHFLYALHIPVMSREEFDTCINDGSLTITGDVLSSTMYRDLEFNISLYQLLDGLIPIDVVRNRHVIEQFVNHCSNNILTLRHYISNPSDISSDFDIQDTLGLNQLKSCLTIEFLNDVNAVLGSDNVHIVSTDRKFEGDPIFRGRVLYLTGEFNHGSKEEIINILTSYACTVTSVFSPDTVHGILVGDVKDNVDGIAIRSARKHNIPIMDECKFFEHYGINEDMKSKL